ncbi:cellulase, partial [Psychromonas aquatilis]
LKEETIEVDNYATVLLPGRTGFVSDKNHVLLNPSYLPMQLLFRMQALYPDYQSQALIDSSNK